MGVTASNIAFAAEVCPTVGGREIPFIRDELVRFSYRQLLGYSDGRSSFWWFVFKYQGLHFSLKGLLV